jgi:hypothetical protein
MGRGKFLPASRCGRGISVGQYIDGPGGSTKGLKYETQGSGTHSVANFKIARWLNFAKFVQCAEK